MNAHAVARERNRDLWDLYELAAGGSYDLKQASTTFARVSAGTADARDVPHAVRTLLSVARVLTEAVAEYERSIAPIPALLEAADGR